MGSMISQRDNFAAKFGLVLRSSAIFYCRQADEFKTTISLLNYWKHKRDLDVTIVASVRDTTGILISRERVAFERGEVVNLRPGGNAFEGSIEIEVFSIRDLVIPYAAAMAIYEAAGSISMVHSYGRVYSRHEVEDGRTISHGEEGCWSIRDRADVRSFCAFHNGAHRQPAQTVRMTLTRADGERRFAVGKLPELAPFASTKLYPSDHVPDLAEWLGGKTGYASITYDVTESFTRMLVGNESAAEFQITHSNFDYSVHGTDMLESGAPAYMRVPKWGGRKRVVVYPDSHYGRYRLTTRNDVVAFRSGEPVLLDIEEGLISVQREDGPMPTRVVTGLIVDNGGALPAECSLGVVNKLQPPKRLWWGACAAGSHLIAHDLPEVYGGIKPEQTVAVRLYSEAAHEMIERVLPAAELDSFDKGMQLDDLFPEARAFLAGGYGYYTAYSDYPGLTWYSTVARGGFVSLEHGF